MSRIEIDNHLINGYIIYSGDTYSAPEVSRAFGHLISTILKHHVHDPIDNIHWEYDAGEEHYVLTMTMADARIWAQTIRFSAEGTWLTFTVPDEFISTALAKRVGIRNSLSYCSHNFQATEIDITVI